MSNEEDEESTRALMAEFRAAIARGDRDTARLILKQVSKRDLEDILAALKYTFERRKRGGSN